MDLLTLLILAGGRSTRMGQDKAWLMLDGLPLVEHVARRLMPLAVEIIFSTNEPDSYAGLLARLPIPARAVADVYQGAGPLAGLHAGLQAASTEFVLAVAADMPFVDRELIEAMREACGAADAIVPRLRLKGFDEPQPEPLHAVYRKTCLHAIEARLQSGRRRMVSLLDAVDVCYWEDEDVRRIDPRLRSFRNINTPQEWDAIRAELRSPD